MRFTLSCSIVRSSDSTQVSLEMCFNIKAISTAFSMIGALALCPVTIQAQDFRQPAASDVQLSGAGGQLADNIRTHIGVPDERCTATQRRLNRLIPALRRDVERAAQALGYYQLTQQLQFTAASALTTDPAGTGTDIANVCWRLEVAVQPGEPVRIGTINIGLSDPAWRSVFAPVLDNLPLRPGDQLDHSAYERIKSQLSSQATEAGFFSARFQQAELAIDLEQNLANINIQFEPGERYRFGAIRINTPDALSKNFVERFLTFSPDSDYSSDALIKQRQNFNDSQYFSRVAVTPLLGQADNNAVPVTVDLTMRPRKAYSVGIGVNTDIGPRLRLAYEDRYFNRRGHRLNADLGLSPLQQEPSLSYVIPLQDPVNDSLRLSGGFQRQETDSYITNTSRIGANHQSLLDSNWIQNIFVNYEQEKSELTNIRDGSDFQERVNSTVSGINWSRSRSNDPIYPTSGWRLFGQVSGAHENLLSDISFAQLYGTAKLVQQVGPGRFLLRAEAATTLADELLELPISVRFFTGGDTSVRGYQYGELGATNDLDEVVGGKHMLVGSVEYDMRVTGNWYAAVFVDSGNSFGDFTDMKLQQSVGLGVRWLSPIGPIRVDVAKALSENGGFRLHITMGPDL